MYRSERKTLYKEPKQGRRRAVQVPIGNVLTVGTLLGLMDPGLVAHGGER